MKYANELSQPTASHEQLSALMDGTLDVAQTQALLDACYQDNVQNGAQDGAQHGKQDGALLQTWASYHAVGDALRTHWVGRATVLGAVDSTACTPAAPVDLAPIAVQLSAPSASAANDSVFRWRMVAGIAAVAAVGSIVWSLAGNPAGTAGVQLAQQAPKPLSQQPALVAQPAGPATVVASSIEAAAPSAVMLRDPRLDELLAAHKQFGGASALQQPAGFLRNATFVPSSR